MKSRLFCLVALVIISVGICLAVPVDTDEDKARIFATESSQNMIKYYDDLASLEFDAENKEGDIVNEFFDNVTKLEANLVKESMKFDYKNFKDEELQYIFGKLRKFADVFILGVNASDVIFSELNDLDRLSYEKDIQSYEDENVTVSYFPDVQNIIAKSNDSNEVLHYWNAWRDINSQWAVGKFNTLVQGLRDAANITGIPANDFWMKDYDLKEMEDVMTQITPFYQELHAFIRNKLHQKYGDSVVDPDGLISDNLFRQVIAQAWTNGSIIDDIYPHEDLPPYDSILEKNEFDTLKLYKMADQFYQSLGFDPIPDDFWGPRLRMKSYEDEGDCKATIYDYTSNIYMKFCQKMDFRKFLQAHGYMGQLYYTREKASLPIYYFNTQNVEYPVGEAVILSASTPKHLNNVGIVTDFEFTDEVMMNRLVRLSIHTILNIPMYYVHTKLMADLLSGAVEFADLNKHYWKLMDQYVGVGSPILRDEFDGFDFPYNFYTDLNQNRQARKFYTEVLGYQFYKEMCSISGQYPEDSLQNCDFYGSRKVGDALKKMMKLGSSKPFHQVLATFLPDDAKLNADSILEYYRPVQNLVTEKNYEADVRPGWTHADMKINSVKLPSEADAGES